MNNGGVAVGLATISVVSAAVVFAAENVHRPISLLNVTWAFRRTLAMVRWKYRLSWCWWQLSLWERSGWRRSKAGSNHGCTNSPMVNRYVHRHLLVYPWYGASLRAVSRRPGVEMARNYSGL